MRHFWFEMRLLAAAVVVAAGLIAPALADQAATGPAQSTPTSSTPTLSIPTQAIGDWDGVTPSAHLAGPYEDPVQSKVLFGIISYENMPWRSYMDTWSASQYTNLPGFNFNIDQKYADSVCTIFDEAGIHNARVEIGWGNLGWDDQLPQYRKDQIGATLLILQKHHIRPMILLNAHHGAPCPMRDVNVTVAVKAAKGDRTIKLDIGKSASIHVGYTGFPDPAYVAAHPLITQIDADGTAHLSSPLLYDVPIGTTRLQELKYQPFQGTVLKDGTPVPAAQETVDGWVRYVSSVAHFVQQTLGTVGKPDSGFDMEVWNEQTFGSNFLDIRNYYDPPREYSQRYTYTKARPFGPGLRPDAQTEFKAQDQYAILPITIDWANDPANGLHNVKVVSGFANQWPWDSGTSLWPGQAGFSRHYYTGDWMDVDPQHPLNGSVDHPTGVIDALGSFEGKHDNRDWHTVYAGSVFVPTLRIALPEFLHTGFKTESLSRDVLPDSRYVYFGGHGRYTNNGDFHPAEVWETEVNYDRSGFMNDVMKNANVKGDDPRMLALDSHTSQKMLLRQYVFHAHKGLKRLFIFCAGANDYSLGMLPQSFYTLLDANKDQLTPAVRAGVPPVYKGLTWFSKLMNTGLPLDAPRPLAVADLIEYKPRLAYAGDGTAANPSKWNRDEFALMPFQLGAGKYAIPYYVVTLDVTHSWNASKDLLDPSRYDMPPQQYDVTIDNIAGVGATVTDYDPLTNASVPVSVVASSPRTMTLRLQAADYPRVLTVTEAQPGPLITNPRISATESGKVTVTWTTNIPVKARLTYGQDWEQRSANEMDMPGTATRFSATLPGVWTGVVAARIMVESPTGLTDVWPRWDEDPAGQTVVPGSKQVVQAVTHAPTVPSSPAPTSAGTPTSLAAPAAVSLPHVETNVLLGFSVRLPAGVAISGSPDSQEMLLGPASDPISLLVRYVPGGASSQAAQMPATSTIDDASHEAVSASGFAAGVQYDYMLAAAAHPGMTNLRQRYLLVPAGDSGADLIVLAFTGSAPAFRVQRPLIQAIEASVAVTR